MRRHAFTLVELLVVIAIIGLLSTVAVVATSSSRNKSRYAKTVADMAQIAKAAELYYSVAGAYPADQGPGVLPPELSPYMSSWPAPPCSGWVYDYENWNSGNSIMVHAQRPGTNTFLYCIYATAGNPCTAGAEITAYSSKSITCSE